jgi:hypothetical protein
MKIRHVEKDPHGTPWLAWCAGRARGACARPHVEVSCGDYRVYRASRHIKHASTVMAGSLYSKNVGVVLVCLCSLNCAMINKEIIQIGESIFGMIMKLCY